VDFDHLRDVRFDAERAPTICLDSFTHSFRSLFLSKVIDDNMRALFGKSERDSATDPA
jgi:hypothetical protein